MAKFHGNIGFAETVEVEPGVWREQIVEHAYDGDLIQAARDLQSSDSINDNVNIANKISIIADPFAEKNFLTMRYVVFMGVKWKIKNVSVSYPRLVLTVGGVYNGQ